MRFRGELSVTSVVILRDIVHHLFRLVHTSSHAKIHICVNPTQVMFSVKESGHGAVQAMVHFQTSVLFYHYVIESKAVDNAISWTCSLQMLVQTLQSTKQAGGSSAVTLRLMKKDGQSVWCWNIRNLSFELDVVHHIPIDLQAVSHFFELEPQLPASDIQMELLCPLLGTHPSSGRFEHICLRLGGGWEYRRMGIYGYRRM